MTKIFTKLRAMVDDALNERSPIIEQDTTLMTAPVERELFDHRILYIEEDMINRMLRAAFRNHWLIYSVTFEFEPNNQVFLSIITKWGNVINVEFTIEDVWFDDYSSSFAIKLDTANIDTGGFILNSVLHLLGNWCLSLFGIFFKFRLLNFIETLCFCCNNVHKWSPLAYLGRQHDQYLPQILFYT